MKLVIDLGPIDNLVGSAATQLPFAVSKALNDTAKQGQDGVRAHIASTFILRHAQFVLNTVKINREDRATKGNLQATFRIDPTRDFLAKFEDGGIKTPRGANLAIPLSPSPAQPSKYIVIPAAYRPKNLHLRVIVARTGAMQIKGDRRTFVIPDRGIFQRTGRGAGSSIQLLYAFRPATRLPAELDLVKIGLAVGEANWAENFNAAWEYAMATAR